jgi:hypothetical protein
MHFIHESTISDLNVCDALIAYHKQRVEQGTAIPGCAGLNFIDYKLKKSVDVSLPTELQNLVAPSLQSIATAYIEKFPWCNKYARWGIRQNPQVQYYGPNDGYYEWHTERTSAQPHEQNRHIVYMVYLNDVTDAGGTEFHHQNLIVQPVKGKSLIWPADWTHTHRGIPSPTQDKYILTGWFEFLE